MTNKGFNQIKFCGGNSSTTVKLPKTYGSFDEFMDELRNSSPSYQALMSDIDRIEKEMERMKQQKR